MKYFELTEEERKILKDFEKGKLVSIKDATRRKRLYQKYAQNTLSKTRNINIRLSGRALAKLKAKAVQQGVPYQTLVSSILYQFSSQ